MKKRTTLKDIARAAGVSETSVSLVLNNVNTRLSQKTKERIRKTAEELNYRPNLLARSLYSQRTNTVGLIVPDIENPFFATLAKRIEEIISKEGYLLFIANSQDKVDNDIKIFRRFNDYQVDGIIYCPSNESYKLDLKNKAKLRDVPAAVVLVDRIFDDLTINQVCFDNELGGYKAVKYLINKGHKKIACLTGDLKTYSANKRYIGYVKALTEANIPIDQSIILNGDYRFASGYNVDVKKMIDMGVTSIFACNDLMAYGICKKLKDEDLVDSLQVVGYDNIIQSEMFDVDMVSVIQDVRLLAELTSQQLLAQIKDREYSKQTVLEPFI